jgi:hypothetical protein
MPHRREFWRSPLLLQARRVNQKPGGRPVRPRCRPSLEKLVGGKERGEFVVQLIVDEQAESLYEIVLYTLANETRRETFGAGHEQRAGKSPTPP